MVRFVEFPGGVEVFQLDYPRCESWAIAHLDGLWHTELRDDVFKEYPSQHICCFLEDGECLSPSCKDVNKS